MAKDIEYPKRLQKQRPYKQPKRYNNKKEAILEKADIELPLLFELLKYYSINPNNKNCWFELSLALAREHVPAFTVSKKRGPKAENSVWGIKHKLLLFVYFKVYEMNGIKILPASELIFKTKMFKHATSSERIRRVYSEIKSNKNRNNSINIIISFAQESSKTDLELIEKIFELAANLSD